LLETSSGKNIPAQFWPLAYWPEGTIKWMGVALVINKNIESREFLVKNFGNKKNTICKKFIW
jgi:hypothetical protein